jgi:L-ascorbate metabolism protein UlaG (beta-lactamase superfamily)
MKTIRIIFALCVLFGYSSIQAQDSKQTALLNKKLNDKEAVIWYLGHCGYAVKTKTKLLIFDYQEKVETPDGKKVEKPANPSLFNGWINPEEIKDLDVVVFVSHSHYDHYDELIFNWEKTVKKIDYVFGWQLKDGNNYHSLPYPRKETKFDGIEIYTVNAHYSGVPESAFLVKVDGLTIFHGGDYIGRMSENGPFHVVEDMKYLKTKANKVDIQFLGAGTYEPNLQILHGINPKVLFPMHYGYREEKYKDFAADLKKMGENVPLFCPEKKGDYTEYRNGMITK